MDRRVQWSGDRPEGLSLSARLPWVKRVPWLRGAALLAGAAVAAAAPSSALDDSARAWVLQASARLPPAEAPSEEVIVVVASAADLEADRCPRFLHAALARGRALRAWLLPPTDVLCHPGAAPPAAPITRASLRMSGGAVVGLAAPSPALGLHAARWVVPASAVPTITLGDLRAGKLPASVLDGRVVVVGVEDELGSAPATRVAAMLGGLLAGGAREEAPRWVGGALCGAVGLLFHLAGRGGARLARLALGAALAALVAGQILAVRLGLGLLPPASLLLGIAVATALPAAREALQWRSALRAARARAASSPARDTPREAGLRTPPLERLAAEAYPADLVLVAELPVGEWRLALHDPRVAEEERDVRRPPYATRDGVPVTQVSETFLGSGAPAVIVPMVALGALEGYLFLCGAGAEQVHLADPDRAARLADELALMLRGRRLEQGEAGAPPDPADLAPLAAFIHDAPTPLLYADELGSVRLLSRSFAARLRALGASAAEGLLDPFALTLTEVICRLTGRGRDEATAAVMAALTRAEGASLLVDLEGTTHTLSLRAVRRRRRGNSWSTGFAASLVEAGERALGGDVRPQDPARVTMVSGAAPQGRTPQPAPLLSAPRSPRVPSFAGEEEASPWEESVEPWPLAAPRFLSGRAGARCAEAGAAPETPPARAARATGGGDGAVSGLESRWAKRGGAVKEG